MQTTSVSIHMFDCTMDAASCDHWDKPYEKHITVISLVHFLKCQFIHPIIKYILYWDTIYTEALKGHEKTYLEVAEST